MMVDDGNQSGQGRPKKAKNNHSPYSEHSEEQGKKIRRKQKNNHSPYSEHSEEQGGQKQPKKTKDNHSPYSLGLYVKCPKQFYFEYLDNYTSAYQNKRKIKRVHIEAGKRKELVFGELLHIALNVLLHLPEEERNREKLLSILKETWTGKSGGARGAEGGFPDIEEERRWYQEAIEVLKKFSQTQNLTPTTAYLPEIEREGEFVDANFLKVNIAPGVVLAGKIDRMDKEDGGFHVIDYKTGRGERDDDFQLMAYSILATEALGMAPTKASYLYLRSGNIKSFDSDAEAVERTKSRVIEIAKQIRSEEEYSPHPTKMCYYCDYLEFCPAKEEAKKFIAEYKGQETEELPF